tara:strand:- start:91 stop:279 length:189 start_codon:yes stop_codon:yes gene_type:complete
MNLIAVILLSSSLYSEPVEEIKIDGVVIASSDVKKKKKKGKKVFGKGKKKKKGFFSKVFGAK